MNALAEGPPLRVPVQSHPTALRSSREAGRAEAVESHKRLERKKETRMLRTVVYLSLRR